LADKSLDDTQRRDRLLALDDNLSMFENAADEQVTHKNLDQYEQELVQDCVGKMRVDEQAIFSPSLFASWKCTFTPP